MSRIAVLALALAALGTAVQAQPAEAAGCTYSNLTSTRVYNKTCALGAYAYRSGNTWYQAGDWVGTGKYSYNWSTVCYQYPGMLGIV
ncbi:hypothetical protein [Cellulomonas flavigena]|uniref:hypothetical protein n=1 Tax=Cellulomonas flavigena TaxID=1711 RepID=UPI0002E070EF|nr:hypothetical protein [Cellulomonas flavigena]